MTHQRKLLALGGLLAVVSPFVLFTPYGSVIAQMKAPPAAARKPVTVPVLTRDVDNPARTALVETCFAESDVAGENVCELTVVPPGKVLVVEMFSGRALADGIDATVVGTWLQFDVPAVSGVVPTVQTVPVFTGVLATEKSYVFSQITRAYLPAGTVVSARVRALNASSQFADFTVFGYLVDCGPGSGCPIP